jgi:hypothetical protein
MPLSIDRPAILRACDETAAPSPSKWHHRRVPIPLNMLFAVTRSIGAVDKF